MTRELLSTRRHLLPSEIAGYLLESARRREPAARFSDLLTLLENLGRHVLGMLNSEYVARATAIPRIEAHLREVDKPAFGHLHSGLRIFLSHLPEPWVIPSLSNLGGKLPTQCARSVAALKAAIEARVKFDIPPARVAEYVSVKVPANRSLGDTSMAAFLEAVVGLRNNTAHKVDRPWWTEDTAWYGVLNSELEPAIYALMAWDPLLQILTGHELITVVEPSARVLSGGFLTEVRRGLPEALQPLGAQTVWSDMELQIDARYAVRREGTTLAEVVTRWAPYPTSKALRVHEAKESYRGRFLSYVLNDGIVTEEERRDLLAAKEAIGLTDSMVAEVEKEAWNELAKALPLWGERSPARENVEFEQIAEQIARSAGLPEGTDVHARMAECAESQRRAILALVEEDEVVEAELVSRRLGVPPQIIQAHLNHLVAQKSLLPMGSELRGETRYYRSYNKDLLDALQRFVIYLQDRKDARVGAVIDSLPLLLPLLEITEKLLASDGYFGDEDGHRLKADLDDLKAPVNSTEIRDDAAPDDAAPFSVVADDDRTQIDLALTTINGEVTNAHGAISESQAAETRREAIAIVVDGQPFPLRSVTKTLVKIGIMLLPNPLFRASLPWTWGRMRYLASAENVRPDGRKFGYEVPCGEGAERVWFEGNIPREDCAYLLGMHLSRLGLKTEVVDAGVSVQELAAVESATEPVGTPLGVVVVRRPAANEETREEIVGNDLHSFLGKLLRFFVEAGLIQPTRLPVSVSRSKTLVGWKPYHPSGKPFSAAVVYRGLFVETDFSPSEAFELAELLYDQTDAEDQGLLLERLAGDDARPDTDRDGDGDPQDPATEVDESQRVRSPSSISLGISVLGREFRGATAPEFAAGIVGLLRTSQHLLDEHLPIRSGGKRYLVHSVPQHMPADDGTERRFRQPKAVGGVFVETNHSKAEFLRHMLNLCRRYDPTAEILAADSSA